MAPKIFQSAQGGRQVAASGDFLILPIDKSPGFCSLNTRQSNGWVKEGGSKPPLPRSREGNENLMSHCPG
jgi:hypothetical protein